MKLKDIINAFEECGYTEENYKKYWENRYYEDHPGTEITYEKWCEDNEARKTGLTSSTSCDDIYYLDKDETMNDRFVLRVFYPDRYDGDNSYKSTIYIAEYFDVDVGITKIGWRITSLDNFKEDMEEHKDIKRTLRKRSSIMDFSGNPLMRWSEKLKSEVYWEMDENGRSLPQMHIGKMPDELYSHYQKMLDDRKKRLEIEAEVTGKRLIWSSSRGYHLKEADSPDEPNIPDMVIDSMVKSKLILRDTTDDEEKGLLN